MNTTPKSRPRPISAGATSDAKVGRAIRQRRREQNLTGEAVAARAGISVSFLSRLESGRREFTLATMDALAQAVGLSMEELVARSKQPEISEAVAQPTDTLAYLRAQATVSRIGYQLLWIGQRWPGSANAAMEAGCTLHAGLTALLAQGGSSALQGHSELARAALAERLQAIANTPVAQTDEGRSLAEVVDLLDQLLTRTSEDSHAGA